MTWDNPSRDGIQTILETSKTIAVVGLSANPDRTSHQIAKIMQENGYRIIPVNPTIDEVLGEKAYDALTDVSVSIDIINVFRRPEFLPAIAEDAVQTDSRIFWAQQGIVNEEAYAYLKQHDFTVIMDLCIKVLHSMLVKQ